MPNPTVLLTSDMIEQTVYIQNKIILIIIIGVAGIVH